MVKRERYVLVVITRSLVRVDGFIQGAARRRALAALGRGTGPRRPVLAPASKGMVSCLMARAS